MIWSAPLFLSLLSSHVGNKKKDNSLRLCGSDLFCLFHLFYLKEERDYVCFLSAVFVAECWLG